jgi:pimeloyl-ACP methyl ester carboxylesterase
MIDTVAISVALAVTFTGGQRVALEVARPLPVEETPAPAEDDSEPQAPESESVSTANREAPPARRGVPARTPRRHASQRGSTTDTPDAPVRGSHALGRATWSISSTAAPVRTPPPPATAPPNTGQGPPDADTLLYYDVRIFGGINGTNTGYKEDFMVYEGHPTQDRPLLIVFHRFGVGYLDAWIHTKFFQEARLRDWHVLAPLSASGVHFGSIEGQIGTEKAIEWTLANLNVDKSRIYAVGFSMGGGAALNFAARHTDPDQYMFAAVADHTGGVSLPNGYIKTTLATQGILDFWFGTGLPGSADYWKMMRSSVIDFDPQTLQVDLTNNLSRNIRHMPVKVWRASNEPALTAYLSEECDVFVTHQNQIGGKAAYEIVPYSEHEWDLLDEGEALQWLGQHTLTVPTNGHTLADHDGSYFHFDVTQDAPGAFTRFSWDVDPLPAINKMDLFNTANLTQLRVDPISADFDHLAPFEMVLSTADDLADEVVLSPWPFEPSAVIRDGVQVFQNWTYDDQTRELTITEIDGIQEHTWVIQP